MTNLADLPFPFSLILRYFWLLAIAGTFVNALFLKMMVKQYVQQDPSLEAGYNKLIYGWVLSSAFPWLVAGMGMIFGKFDTVFDIVFGLSIWNIFSLLFFGSTIAEAILFFGWVWFGNGVEFLIKYRGVANIPRSPRLLKIWAVTLLAASFVIPISVLVGFPTGSF